jgi:hypothetical protein
VELRLIKGSHIMVELHQIERDILAIGKVEGAEPEMRFTLPAFKRGRADPDWTNYWRPYRLAALFSLFSLFALMTGYFIYLSFLSFLLFLLPTPARPKVQP